MSKYNREQIISIFDKKAVSAKSNTDIAKTRKSTIQIAGETAVKRLKLTRKIFYSMSEPAPAIKLLKRRGFVGKLSVSILVRRVLNSPEKKRKKKS